MMKGAAILVAASVLYAHPLAAQQLVPVGARVRAFFPEEQRQVETRFGRRNQIRGEVTAVSADSLWVRPSPVTGSVGISRAGIRTLYVSKGTPRRWVSMLTEGLAGAVLGAVEGALLYSPGGRWSWGDSRAESARNGAIFAGIFTGVLGFALPIERWREIPPN